MCRSGHHAVYDLLVVRVVHAKGGHKPLSVLTCQRVQSVGQGLVLDRLLGLLQLPDGVPGGRVTGLLLSDPSVQAGAAVVRGVGALALRDVGLGHGSPRTEPGGPLCAGRDTLPAERREGVRCALMMLTARASRRKRSDAPSAIRPTGEVWAAPGPPGRAKARAAPGALPPTNDTPAGPDVIRSAYTDSAPTCGVPHSDARWSRPGCS